MKTFLVSAANLTDQDFLFEWARMAIELICENKDEKKYLYECIETAKNRIDEVYGSTIDNV